MGLRGPGAKPVAQAKNVSPRRHRVEPGPRVPKPQEGEPEITPAMIRAFRRGDQAFFIRVLRLQSWSYSPLHRNLDAACEYPSGMTSYQEFMVMRRLRWRLLKEIGEKIPTARRRGREDESEEEES